MKNLKITIIFLILVIKPSTALCLDYFVGTLDECTAYISKMDSLMGYPNPPTKTTTYAKARIHDNNPSKFLVIIKSVHSPKIGRQISIAEIDAGSSIADIAKRISRSILESQGAFPQTLDTLN